MTAVPAISARGVCKSYQLYERPSDRLRQMLWGRRRSYYREFWALRETSFEVARGEVLGLIGRNGAGKSTLLQLLCGTLEPSAGSIAVNGRVAALLELGAGFSPEFSGRENVYLAAAVLGLKSSEIDARFEQIVDFSGIRDFIDQPVKTYSSGMYVRLAFSVATSVDPDILVVDEALSVGDGEFARKSFDRIMGLKQAGKTILICSHSMFQIESICSRVLWLDHGRIVDSGDPARVIKAYQAAIDRSALASPEAQQPLSPPAPKGHARLTEVIVAADGVAGKTLAAVSGKTDLSVELAFVSDPQLPAPSVAVTLHGPDDRILASAGAWNDGVTLERNAEGAGRATLTFPRLPLLRGAYGVGVHLFCERGLHNYEWANPVAVVDVTQSGVEQGVACLPRQWKVRAAAPGDSQPLPAPGSGRSERWQASWASAAEEGDLLDLFRAAFGHDMPPAQWLWKYTGMDPIGSLVREDGRIVAFYGGIARPIRRFGGAETAVQMVDVMVHPRARGVLTRRGPFYFAASAFIEGQVGPGHPYQIGFGFPSDKHMRLGERLGLYRRVGELMELSWPPARDLPRLGYRLRQYGAAEARAADALWQRMAADLGDAVVGVRDAAWLRHRYLEHPTASYLPLLATQRFSAAPLGIVVLRDKSEALELVDLVAPMANIPLLVDAARRVAQRLGNKRLTAWISASHSRLFETPQMARQAINIAIANTGTADTGLDDRWWLMAGDTDFR